LVEVQGPDGVEKVVTVVVGQQQPKIAFTDGDGAF